jgi:AcrR family transcriptional regulator
MAGPLTRRMRKRAATREEITQTARRLLVEQGPEAASLRAIAREMGMTAPGLYRYYDSREELLRHVIAEIFRELAACIREAIEAAVDPLAPPADARERMSRKFVAACQEFRRWAVTHKEEFGLLFGFPVPGLAYEGSQDIADQSALEFTATFYVLFLELWDEQPFPVPAEPEIDPALRPQLERFRAKLGASIPAGAALVFLRCWVLLYGALAMEVFGHLNFALDDSAPMFEVTISELASRVGLTYPWPGMAGPASGAAAS